MQPKIGLHRTTSGWQACRAGAPSTWIVKLAHPVDSVAADVIDTEVLALGLARTIGLTSVTAQIHEFGGVRAMAVSRYDRVESAPGCAAFAPRPRATWCPASPKRSATRWDRSTVMTTRAFRSRRSSWSTAGSTQR